jgi:hypothetical protein
MEGRNMPLRDFFRQLARKTFGDLGLFDSEVVTYVAGVLADFARADRLHRLRTAGGRPVDSVVDILTRPETAPPGALPLLHQRELRKYIGDYTLFMSGMFRGHVERQGFLDFYIEEGRQSYWKVSEVDVSLYRTGFLLFQELSKKFEYYSGALDYMRKTYFALAPGQDPFADFLEQIEHWLKVGLSSN